MGNSVSVSPLERLVKAAGSGDITECESIRVDFFSKERSKHRSATEITQSFSNFLNSVESNAALNAVLASCVSGGLTTLEWCLQHGADPNVLSSNGNTALHLVISNQNQNIRRQGSHMVAALLNAGIRADSKNRSGITPLALARSIDKGLLGSSQVLRTLEVNGSRWHGVLGVEEHGDVAKLAGSVLGIISGGGAILGGRSSQSPQDLAAETRNKVSKWAGGVFKPRWACVTAPRLGSDTVLAVYESFTDTKPIFCIPVTACDLGAPLEKVAKQGALKPRSQGALDSVSNAVDTFRGHGGYAIKGLKPEDVMVRASLTSPKMSVHVQLDTPSYEALARVLRDSTHPAAASMPQPDHGPRMAAEAVVAVPAGAASADLEVAEAVFVGPVSEEVEVQILNDEDSDKTMSSGGTRIGQNGAGGGGGGGGVRTTPEVISNDVAPEMSEDEMIAEAIRRSNLEVASKPPLPLIPTKPTLPSAPSPTSESVATHDNLPYGGDLQAAMRAQDRDAIRLLMASRKPQQTSPSPSSLPSLPSVPLSTAEDPADDEIQQLEARLASLRSAQQREQDV